MHKAWAIRCRLGIPRHHCLLGCAVISILGSLCTTVHVGFVEINPMKNKLLALGVGGTIVAILCCFHAIIADCAYSPWSDGPAWLSLQRRCFAADLGRFSYTDGVRAMATETIKVVLESTLTCPSCGHVETETMPTDACQWFYECKSCQTVLKPLKGDCCVYCSYATVPCPPIQEGKSCCA